MSIYPTSIQSLIGQLTFRKDEMGMGNSHVHVFIEKPWVLKVFYDKKQGYREIEVMKWLAKQGIPVPEIIKVDEDQNHVYLVMTKLSGVMSCDESLLNHPKFVIDRLVEGIHMLQKININACPFPLGLAERLKMAKAHIDQNEVDMDTWDPEIIKGRFHTPEELYEYLVSHQPDEDLVFVHGDYCLPNVFINDHHVSGFIDLSLAGIADKYQDLALCLRSIKYNFETDKYKDYFYKKFNVTMDEEKIDYYLLLDELF